MTFRAPPASVDRAALQTSVRPIRVAVALRAPATTQAFSEDRTPPVPILGWRSEPDCRDDPNGVCQSCLGAGASRVRPRCRVSSARFRRGSSAHYSAAQNRADHRASSRVSESGPVVRRSVGAPRARLGGTRRSDDRRRAHRRSRSSARGYSRRRVGNINSGGGSTCAGRTAGGCQRPVHGGEHGSALRGPRHCRGLAARLALVGAVSLSRQSNAAGRDGRLESACGARGNRTWWH